MRKFSLTISQQNELNKALIKMENAEKEKRIYAVKNRSFGRSYKEIGKLLSKSPQTIRIWIKAYEQGGIEALLYSGNKGRVSQLTKEQLTILREINEKKGFKKALDAKNHIKKNFDIDYHLHWVQELVKRNFELP